MDTQPHNVIDVELSFGRSTSDHYSAAVAYAEKMPGYSCTGEGRQARHSVRARISVDDLALWGKFRHLEEFVGSWRSSSFKVNGSLSSFPNVDTGITFIAQCHARRKAYPAGDEYCSGKNAPDEEATAFGCRYARGVSPTVGAHSRQHDGWWDQYGALDWSERADLRWYQFGALDEGNLVFRVDKERIFSTVKSCTEQGMCTRCPFFSWDAVRASVDALPDSIDLATSELWEVKRSNVTPDAVLGIQPKRNEGLSAGIGISLFPSDDGGNEPPVRAVPNVRYSDVAGQSFAVEQIRNVVQLPLSHPEYFAELGVRPQTGAILYGAPGNGKTLIAKAVAGESEAHFELINGPEILSKWVGQSEENLRKAFDRARYLAPSVVLIDEIDSIAPRRDLMTDQHDVRLISQTSRSHGRARRPRQRRSCRHNESDRLR